MVKVSISLPNNTQITVESQEPEVIHEIVGMVLRDLPLELMRTSTPESVVLPAAAPSQKGTSVQEPPPAAADPDTDASTPEPADGSNEDWASLPAESSPATEQAVSKPADRRSESSTSGHQTAQQAARSAAAELAFIQFCQSTNPLGDMRKVVVAAEGASQFLQIDSVNTEDLADLFERIGWRHPHSFTQTLRNAARSKFRWLERVPGRSGHYTVTALGRTTTLNP